MVSLKIKFEMSVYMYIFLGNVPDDFLIIDNSMCEYSFYLSFIISFQYTGTSIPPFVIR